MHTHTLHRLVGCTLVLLLAAGCFQTNGLDLAATDVLQQAPTFTPPPTSTFPPTYTPFPTLTPQSEGAAESLLNQDFLLNTPADLAQAPTADPLLLTVTSIFGQQQVEQAPAEPLDPIAITATFIVERATQTAAAPLTQAAIQAGIGLATPTPTTDPNLAQIPAPNVPLAPGADCIHEVRATDRNLYRIALNYGLTVQEIAQASGIANVNLIYVGQKLTIPGCGVTGARPLPTSTSNVPVAVATTPAPGTTPVIGVTFTPIPDAGGQTAGSVTGGQIHVVQQGETLFQISLRYGVLVNDIAARNGIANINLIYIGQELVIP